MGRSRYGVREEIKGTADAFYRALTNKNLKAVENEWAHVPYAAVAGRSGELEQGWDHVRRYWEHRFRQTANTTIKVKLINMVCHAVGDVAWLSGVELRTISDSEGTRDERLRVTCVLERQGTGWQIVSYHASLPKEDGAVPTPAG